MKAILLARVSTKDQEEGLSIPSQVRRLTEYALKKNLQVQQTYQVTESSSKETRKQFDTIIQQIRKSKEPIALVTDTIDRLQRSFRETPILDELRKEGRLELHFYREGLIVHKNSNSSQLQQWDIGVLFASSYVRQLSDNVKRSKEQGYKNGSWSAKAPFGYKNITLPDGKTKDIVPDPYESLLVIKIFEMYAGGNQSFQTIAQEMNRLGLKNASGNLFLPNRVELTLKNHFYYGVMRIKGEIYRHKYQPLISEQLFKTVQRMMSGRRKAPAQYAGKPILLRGLISCKYCGCTVTGDIKKQKYIYYSCSNSKGICTRTWVREERIVATLLENFDPMALSDDQTKRLLTHLKKTFEQEQELLMQNKQRLAKESELIQGRISRLIDMHLDGQMDTETYQTKLREYKQRQNEIAMELQSYKPVDESTLITINTVLHLARNAKDIYESSNLDKKQLFLRFIFSNLQLDGENLHLELKEPFFSMQKMSDEPEWLGRKDSNLRMPGPKPGALPLGDAPIRKVLKNAAIKNL